MVFVLSIPPRWLSVSAWLVQACCMRCSSAPTVAACAHAQAHTWFVPLVCNPLPCPAHTHTTGSARTSSW